jgi:thiol-disulfide isomerase/thioredoxin
MFYNISYSTDTFPNSIKKLKKETQIKYIPNISFTNLANETLDLNKTLKKNILIVNFWALWCSPCIKEMPVLKELSNKLDNTNSMILFINQDNFKDYNRVDDFVEKLGISKNNVLMDFDMKSYKNFLLKGIPTTLIIDNKGKILWRIEGVIDWADQNLLEWLKTGAKKN